MKPAVHPVHQLEAPFLEPQQPQRPPPGEQLLPLWVVVFLQQPPRELFLPEEDPPVTFQRRFRTPSVDILLPYLLSGARNPAQLRYLGEPPLVRRRGNTLHPKNIIDDNVRISLIFKIVTKIVA